MPPGIARAIGEHQRRPFLRAPPVTFAFLAAWSLGEAVGYVRGPVEPERVRV